MRTLVFSLREKVELTEIHEERIDAPKKNYSRHVSVVTRGGVVMVTSFKWQHNFGWDVFTIFQTVKDGYLYKAECPECITFDRQIKWMASHFSNQIISQK